MSVAPFRVKSLEETYFTQFHDGIWLKLFPRIDGIVTLHSFLEHTHNYCYGLIRNEKQRIWNNDLSLNSSLHSKNAIDMGYIFIDPHRTDISKLTYLGDVKSMKNKKRTKDTPSKAIYDSIVKVWDAKTSSYRLSTLIDNTQDSSLIPYLNSCFVPNFDIPPTDVYIDSIETPLLKKVCTLFVKSAYYVQQGLMLPNITREYVKSVRTKRCPVCLVLSKQLEQQVTQRPKLLENPRIVESLLYYADQSRVFYDAPHLDAHIQTMHDQQCFECGAFCEGPETVDPVTTHCALFHANDILPCDDHCISRVTNMYKALKQHPIAKRCAFLNNILRCAFCHNIVQNSRYAIDLHVQSCSSLNEVKGMLNLEKESIIFGDPCVAQRWCEEHAIVKMLSCCQQGRKIPLTLIEYVSGVFGYGGIQSPTKTLSIISMVACTQQFQFAPLTPELIQIANKILETTIVPLTDELSVMYTQMKLVFESNGTTSMSSYNSSFNARYMNFNRKHWSNTDMKIGWRSYNIEEKEEKECTDEHMLDFKMTNMDDELCILSEDQDVIKGCQTKLVDILNDEPFLKFETLEQDIAYDVRNLAIILKRKRTVNRHHCVKLWKDNLITQIIHNRNTAYVQKRRFPPILFPTQRTASNPIDEYVIPIEFQMERKKRIQVKKELNMLKRFLLRSTWPYHLNPRWAGIQDTQNGTIDYVKHTAYWGGVHERSYILNEKQSNLRIVHTHRKEEGDEVSFRSRIDKVMDDTKHTFLEWFNDGCTIHSLFME